MINTWFTSGAEKMTREEERNKITKLIDDACRSLPDVTFRELEYYYSVAEVLGMLKSWADDLEQQVAAMREVIARHE